MKNALHRFLTQLQPTPLTRKRLQRFRRNKVGFSAFILFCFLFIISMCADFIANDKPILVWFDGALYMPIYQSIPETAYGGDFPTEAVYTDPFVQDLIKAKGWMLWPPIPYGYISPSFDLDAPAPTPPDSKHWLGTDDQARDVAARLIHGMKISLQFGLALTFFSSIIGLMVGVVQGYFGGLTDLFGQRLIEVWGALPTLYLLIILSSIVQPNFSWLLGLMILMGWPALVGLVRAETLRVRNFDYVRAAKALGIADRRIIWSHILPNASVASLTFLPFIATASITTLTALDFIGFGLPAGSASLGELLKQGKENLSAPWLGLSGFFAISVLLTLLVFVGEATRDAFDPRKNHRQNFES
ncbi:MAG: ABC transporter permease [Alphaproteobacteria bacterium]